MTRSEARTDTVGDDLQHVPADTSDCIICAREHPDGPDLKVDQVIEGLAHRREEERVEIPILLNVRNPDDDVPAVMRVVHRTFVTARLQRFRFDSENPLLSTMRDLYAGRLRPRSEDPSTAFFHRRINCLRATPEPDIVGLNGPGGCFEGKDEVELTPEFDQGDEPSFSSFLLPPVAPRRRELFVLWLTLEGESYRQLVGDGRLFTVDSYSRLLRQLKTFDVPNAPEAGKKIYRDYIEPPAAIIAPAAYDIVIFQGDLGDPIAVEAGSICILPVQPENKQLAENVLWFYGQPKEFYLVLRYGPPSGGTQPATEGFVVARPGTLV